MASFIQIASTIETFIFNIRNLKEAIDKTSIYQFEYLQN